MHRLCVRSRWVGDSINDPGRALAEARGAFFAHSHPVGEGALVCPMPELPSLPRWWRVVSALAGVHFFLSSTFEAVSLFALMQPLNYNFQRWMPRLEQR